MYLPRYISYESEFLAREFASSITGRKCSEIVPQSKTYSGQPGLPGSLILQWFCPPWKPYLSRFPSLLISYIYLYQYLQIYPCLWTYPYHFLLTLCTCQTRRISRKVPYISPVLYNTPTLKDLQTVKSSNIYRRVNDLYR